MLLDMKEVSIVLHSRWCDCDGKDALDKWVYREKHICNCSIHESHYHCPECGGIIQID